MQRREFMLALGGALASGSAARAAPCGPSATPLAALAAFELEPCFRALTVRRRPSSVIAPDGATRHNVATPLQMQDQAAALGWVRYGRLYRDPAAVAAGWRAVDWGLQAGTRPGWAASADAVHQVTWFLEAMACAMALDPAGATRPRTAGLRSGLDWLEEPARRAHAEGNNRIFTHRCWMRASLFRSAGAILGDARLASRSEQNAEQGLGQQRADGVFPERGGPDVGYQILSLQYLQRWLAMRAPGALGARGMTAHDKALGWYLSRVAGSGVIDRSGSTRIGVEKDKDVRYGRAVEILLGAGLLTGDPKWVRNAARLERGAIADGQAPATQLDIFQPRPDGNPSPAVLRECSLCAM